MMLFTSAYAVLIALQGACVPYAPQVVDLKGTLVREVRYGPPNYGENPKTDKRMRIWVLKLSQPISMCSDPTGSALEGIREVQVFFKQAPTTLRGRVVHARGTVEQATLGPQLTPVVMYVQRVTRDP